jgi:flagellar motor switch/type III secretory pathway protein FliN
MTVDTPAAPSPTPHSAESTNSALLHTPTSEKDQSEQNRSWADPSQNAALAGLPLQLDVSVPIPNFRIRHLLALEKGAVLETAWPYAEDVPIWCGGAQLTWTEFEVVDDVLAVRVTRVL